MSNHINQAKAYALAMGSHVMVHQYINQQGTITGRMVHPYGPPQIFFTKEHGIHVGQQTSYALPRGSFKRDSLGQWHVRSKRRKGDLVWKKTNTNSLPARLKTEALLLGVQV